MKSAKPVRASVITLTALVSRKSTAERSATRCLGAPRSISSQAPTAMLPAPPSDTAAPKASSLSATRAPKRIGARSNTWRKASTYPRQESTSSPTAAAIHPACTWVTWWATP